MPVEAPLDNSQAGHETTRFGRSVERLVADDTLTRQAKIALLMRWQHEARVSEMRGHGSRNARLTVILRALHSLEVNDFV